MGLYAANTAVSEDRSKAEIERTLRRYGADQFVSGWEIHSAVIMFRMNRRHIRFNLPLKSKEDFKMTAAGRRRYYQTSIDRAHEQDVRQRWRALALAIKAKLEAVHSGITSFEEEFLAHIMLPNGQTYGQFAIPQIETAYESKTMPPLLGAGSVK